ncbi:protein REVEILLE 6-like [Primulina tabacum]|uniref:protein REVEILLE 6-like n=1 Tax=Primulina tabacum TaxID=48773 RepID=UPI003F5945FF
MLSLTTNPPDSFPLDPAAMALPNLGSFSSPGVSNAICSPDDPNKKIRKPYTITKSRESWTEPEHDKFLEALHLFDRDWKKIEAFVGSKTVIQIRSHAQKYFLKVQKSGTSEHLPPPRPKRKAAHPYPQKASKIATAVTQAVSAFQSSPAVPDPGFGRRPNSSPLFMHSDAAASNHNWTDNSVHTTSLSHATRDDVKFATQSLPSNYYCSSNESTPRTRPTVLPDFAQVYSFIGSVFDPNVTDQLQELKKMDPIDVETVLLLMKNLSINLASPDFEDHRRLLSSYEIDSEKDSAYDVIDHILGSESEDAT